MTTLKIANRLERFNEERLKKAKKQVKLALFASRKNIKKEYSSYVICTCKFE